MAKSAILMAKQNTIIIFNTDYLPFMMIFIKSRSMIMMLMQLLLIIIMRCLYVSVGLRRRRRF